MAAKRSPNFTESEKEIFLTVLLPKYKEVIENKKTDALTNSEKAAAWLSLTLDFNTISTVYKRTENNLKNLWDTLKKNAKKAHNSQRTDILKPGKYSVMQYENCQRRYLEYTGFHLSHFEMKGKFMLIKTRRLCYVSIYAVTHYRRDVKNVTILCYMLERLTLHMKTSVFQYFCHLFI